MRECLTVMRVPFTEKQSKVSLYYEIAFDGGEANFLEEVFYNFNQKGQCQAYSYSDKPKTKPPQ